MALKQGDHALTADGTRVYIKKIVPEYAITYDEKSTMTDSVFLHTLRPVAPATERKQESGPVRTVTRREIVPGTYGGVEVTPSLSVTTAYLRTPDELREAAHIFNQIAEALEEGEAA